MKYRKLGRSGLRVSEVSLGSWLTFGDGDGSSGVARIHRARELGVNLFDTADVYANGRAEEVLGRALADLPRHELVIATKCFWPMSDDPNDRGLSRKHVVESVERSLRRLRTDYVDLHQCHRFDPETPLEETVAAYDDLVRQGKVLYWGVSEWGPSEILDAVRIARASSLSTPISNQPQYSLLHRHAERKVFPACREAGIGQLVFSPLAQGVLTGKYGGGARPEGSRATSDKHGRWMQEFLSPEVLERVERIRPLADAAGLTPGQLALAWCLREPGVASVIVGATSPEQVDENVAAAGVELPGEVVSKLEELFPLPSLVERAMRRLRG
jgi:voltage-dependent potassium channel beta subunit